MVGCVPFVGAGVFAEGPLSVRSLTDALRCPTPIESDCLATVAEYRERFLGTRDRFLAELHKIVADQSRDVTLPPALDMLVGMERRPPLVVATTHDQLIEKALTARGRPFAVVTHVISAADVHYKGKILVVRGHAAPVFSDADKVELADHEFIIYRPLGSPLLHDALHDDLEIDTVVITETDHLTFLGRLENQQMQVPTCFSRSLQRRPLLFLGYGLDVWHYRLMMHVFQSVGGRGKETHAIAVRRPASEMESLTWRRLGADVVQLDSNEFARRVMAPAATM